MLKAVKMHYLVAHLEGEASKFVGHLNITGENFFTAMKVLKDRYENKEIIAEALRKRIFDMNDTLRRNSESPEKTLLTIEEVTIAIGKADTIFENQVPWLVYSVSWRFSEEMKVISLHCVKEKGK
jgi:Protein of unknown function (DUF1759)